MLALRYLKTFSSHFSVLGASLLLSGVLLPYRGFAQSQAQGQTISFDIVKNCLLPAGAQGTFLGAAGYASGDDRLGRLNLKCDHQFLLSQGVSIHRLNDVYLDAKLTTARRLIGAQPSFDLINHFAVDGTCFLSDVELADPQKGNDPNGAWTQCEKRLQRAAADAVFMTREETLRLNEGRRELESGKGTTFVGGLTGNTPDAPNAKLMKDLRLLVKPPKTPGNAPIDPSRRLQTTAELLKQPYAVNFGSTGGAATLKAVQDVNSGAMYEAKKENLDDFSQQSHSRNGDAIVDVADKGAQAKFSKGISHWNMRVLSAQQRKDIADAEATRKAIASGSYIHRMKDTATGLDSPLVSEVAIKLVVDNVIQTAKAAKAKATGKPVTAFSDDAVDEFDIKAPIKSEIGAGAQQTKPGAPGPKGSTPVPDAIDDKVQQAMKDVETAVDNIKSTAP